MAQQMRLGTAARGVPPSQMGRPVGTAIRPLGTAARPLGTAIRGDPNYVSVGMATQVKIADRPVTQHGLTGIKGIQGPGRQIYDKSYFMSQIRNKSSELIQEIQKFKKKIEESQKDNQLFLQLEKKYEQLSKEVRSLEGKLADYNLASDKFRSGTRPEDIRSMYEHIKSLNDRLRAQLDEVFLERKTQEDQLNSVEGQLNEIQRNAEMKLNELDPEKKSEYEALLNENKLLIQDIGNQRNEIEDINMKLSQVEEKLRLDPNKLKAQNLRENLGVLEAKKADLEVQTNESNLSFPEARDRLMAKIKEDNVLIVTTDKRVKELKKIVENYDKQLKDMQSDLQTNKNDEQEKQKYEILYQRDKEMTEFINGFNENRKHEIEEMNQIEQRIVELLEATSKQILLTKQLPTTGENFKQLKDELDFKKNQMDNSEQTYRRLLIECEQRYQEKQQFDMMEDKFEKEIINLRERTTKRENEINDKYSKINEVKAKEEAKKEKLLQEKEELTKQIRQFKEEFMKINYDYELKKQKLNMNEIYQDYQEQEKQFAQNETQIYSLTQYINTKTVDMNYDHMSKKCIDLIEEVNKFNLQNKNNT